jgi:hypothetical protein
MPNLKDQLKKRTILNSVCENSCQVPITNAYKSLGTHFHKEQTVMNLLGIA